MEGEGKRGAGEVATAFHGAEGRGSQRMAAQLPI
jgi:hypothetical protein